MTSKSIHDADALLLYKVGPVHCCSPTLPVESVIMPPHLTHPPGTTASEPGVFKTAQGIVKAVDLRKRFGVDKKDWKTPGRIIVVEVEGGHAGMWVDEIVDVIQSPSRGWSGVPACIPKDVFTRTLLLDDVIQLYADFENIYKFREVGYLRQHIENLKAKENNKQLEDENKVEDRTDIPTTSKNSYVSLSKDKCKEDPLKIDRANLEQSSIVSDSALSDHKLSDDTSDVHSKNEEVENVKSRSDELVKSFQPKEIISSSNKIEKSVISKQKESISSRPVSAEREQVDVASFSRKTSEVPSKNEINNSAKLKPLDTSPLLQETKYKRNNFEHQTDDSGGGYYVAFFLVLMLLAGGGYSLYSLFPTMNNPDEYAFSTGQDSVENYKRRTDGTGVYKEGNITEEITDESSEENSYIKESVEIKDLESEVDVLSEFHAEIKKDKEGLVILLTQPEEKQLPQLKEVSVDSVNSVEEVGNELSELKGENNSNKDSKVDIVVEPVERLSVKEVKETRKGERLTNAKVIIHIVVKGDTLWHIAKRYIHNPFRYPELARLSHIKNPDLIYPGNKVKIVYKNLNQ
jgi:chemotaxis signal transduction protein/LysM repeat protein